MNVLVVAIVAVVIAGGVGAIFLARRFDQVRQRLDAIKAERQRKIREDGLPAELDYALAQIDRELDVLRAGAGVDVRKADRLDEIRSLLVRVAELRPAPFDAVACCVEEVAAWRDMHPERAIALDHPNDPVELLGDEALFRWALREMFLNVVAHAGDWSTVRLKIGATDGDPVLELEDDGDGPELMMVSRFYGAFTPRIESPGPGLGLFVVRAIVERMGGSIHASPGSRGGLLHTLRLSGAATGTATAEPVPAAARA